MNPFSSGQLGTASLEELTALVLAEARNEFIRMKHYGHVAMVVYQDDMKLFSFASNTRAERNNLVEQLTGIVRATKARGVFQIAEAWSAPAPEKGKAVLMPREHPKRKEILIVQREWRGEKSLAWCGDIIRTPNTVDLAAWEGPGEAMSGLLLLMKPKGN